MSPLGPDLWEKGRTPTGRGSWPTFFTRGPIPTFPAAGRTGRAPNRLCPMGSRLGPRPVARLPPDMALDVFPQIRDLLEPDAKAHVLPYAIAEHGDDRALLHPVGDPDGAVNDGARGNTGEDRFLRGQILGGCKGAPAVHDDLPVQQAGVQDGRDEALLQAPQPLDQVSRAGLHRHDPHAGLVFLPAPRTP